MATITRTTIEGDDVFGRRRVYFGVYTGPASYLNGADDGDSFTAAEVNMGTIDLLVFENPVDTANPAVMRAVTYNVSTARVLWFLEAFTQVTDTTDLSTFTCRFMAIGR